MKFSYFVLVNLKKKLSKYILTAFFLIRCLLFKQCFFVVFLSANDYRHSCLE